MARAPAPCEQAPTEPLAWWQRALPLSVLALGGGLTAHVSGELRGWADGLTWSGHVLAWLVGLGLSGLASAALWVLLSARSRQENHAWRRHTDWAVLSRVALAAPHPLLVTDRGLRITWINFPFVAEFGANEAQVYECPLSDWLQAQGLESGEWARVSQLLAQRQPADVVLCPEGGQRRWVASLTPCFDPPQRFRGYVARFDDAAAPAPVAAVLKRLQREHAAWRRAIDRLVIVSETDRCGRIIQVNQAFLQASGYAPEALMGQTHRVINSGCHPPEFWQHMWETISRGQPWRGEVCNRAKDGRLYWLDSLVEPVCDEQGRIERFFSICSDITRHRRVEAALEASQRMLARTGALARVGGWYLEANSRQLYMSAECMYLLQAEPDPASSVERVMGYALPYSSPAVEAVRAVVLAQRESFDCVIEVTVGPGHRRHIRLVGDAQRPGIGPCIIGAAQDVTEQIEAQRRVEQSEAILRSAIDAMGEAFALYDAQQRLVFCNDRYRAMAFRQPEELLLGMRYEDVLRLSVERGTLRPRGQDFQAWVQQRLLKTRQDDCSELCPMEDGRWIRFVDRRTPDGFHVALRIDVTEMQRALEAAQAASRAKSQFLANMSHEIRTPMNAVMGLLQLLRYTPLNQRQRDLTDKALGAARSLLGVVNDILDYSKAEAGKMALDPQPFESDALFSELSALLSSTLGDKPLDLVFDIDPRLPRALQGDSLRLRQVLINLGVNAIRFTERGEVALRVQVLEWHGETVRLAWEVCDTGVGLTPEQQRRLFQPYEQADASTARQRGGTGLGLMICQRLVALMGGELQVRSTPGAGSVFGFELLLPVVDVGAWTDAAAEALPAGLSVWLVDGHAASRTALCRLLQAMGWQVQAYASGGEAARALAQTGEATPLCDVLLVDAASLCGADGEVVPWVERVRERGALRLQRVVVLTACAGGIDAIRAVGRPASWRWESVLIKPLTPGMLARAVRQGMGRAAPEPEPAPARLYGLRVLLVEDDVLNRDVALQVLSLLGAQAVAVGDGHAAIEALRAEPDGFDAVLMDMELPVLDGLEATRRIRQEPRLRHLPVIAMTANQSVTDAQACLAAGMDAHLAKPFTMEALAETVAVRVAQARAAGRRPAMPQPPVPATCDGPAPDVRDAFRRAVPQYVQRLDDGLMQRQRAALQTVGHQLRGAAAYLGLVDLAQAAAALETQAKAEAAEVAEKEASDAVLARARALREALHAAARRVDAEGAGDGPGDGPMAALLERAEGAGPARHPDDLARELDALQQALRAADLTVFERMDRLEAAYGAAPLPGWAAVREAVDQADFETAWRAIEQSRLGEQGSKDRCQSIEPMAMNAPPPADEAAPSP